MSERGSRPSTTTFAFHHIGMACTSIARAAALQELLGYAPEGAHFDDDRQGVRGRFFIGGGPRLELLESLPGSRTLKPWLAGGDRIYHQAFVVEEIGAGLEQLTRHGAKVVAAPAPAAAFGGRSIAFALLRTMAMVELIEAPVLPAPSAR